MGANMSGMYEHKTHRVKQQRRKNRDPKILKLAPLGEDTESSDSSDTKTRKEAQRNALHALRNPHKPKSKSKSKSKSKPKSKSKSKSKPKSKSKSKEVKNNSNLLERADHKFVPEGLDVFKKKYGRFNKSIKYLMKEFNNNEELVEAVLKSNLKEFEDEFLTERNKVSRSKKMAPDMSHRPRDKLMLLIIKSSANPNSSSGSKKKTMRR